MTPQKPPRIVNRDISEQWSKFIDVASTIHYGRIEQMEFRDKKPRFIRLTYDLNFEDLPDLQNKLEELRTLPLLDDL